MPDGGNEHRSNGAKQGSRQYDHRERSPKHVGILAGVAGSGSPAESGARLLGGQIRRNGPGQPHHVAAGGVAPVRQLLLKVGFTRVPGQIPHLERIGA